MSRWLQAAKMARPPNDKIDLNDKNAGDGIKSNKSILSERGGPEFPSPRLPAVGSSRAPAPAVEGAPVTAHKSDAELYAGALRRIQPCGYGPVAAFLGWGMTRAANAETVLREAGRIRYDHTGRGVFVDGPIPSRVTGEKS